MVPCGWAHLQFTSGRTSLIPAPQKAATRGRSAVTRWRCSTDSPPSAPFRKAALWTAWGSYVAIAFFSDAPPGNSVFHISNELKLALDMSLNFWFIMPTFLPQFAPVVHPALEGLFNFTVTFAVGLTLGFLSDGGSRQRVKYTPFVAGSAFLTNVFYLLYLALRQPNPLPPTPAERETVWMRIAESKALPITLLGVGVLSILWAAAGRPDGGFGDLSQRLDAIVAIVQSDRLAWTFVVDSCLFVLFQGALVPDDMSRRGFSSPSARTVATAVPFFGLIYYLWVRPPLLDAKE